MSYIFSFVLVFMCNILPACYHLILIVLPLRIRPSGDGIFWFESLSLHTPPPPPPPPAYTGFNMAALVPTQQTLPPAETLKRVFR